MEYSNLASQYILYFFFISTWVSTFISVNIKRNSRTIAINFSASVIIWYAYLILVTEVLSVFHSINRLSIISAWVIFLLAQISLQLREKKKIKKSLNLNFLHQKFSDLKQKKIAVLLLVIILAIIIKNTVLALIVVPMNWDSMTYHLPRIMFWIEHQSVEHYFTNISRQNWVSPFPEYINLHCILIVGTDLFVNLVQNWAACGCSVLVAMILKNYFKCSDKVCLLSMLICLSINQLSFESVTTQTDILSAFILLNAINILLYIVCNNRLSLNRNNILLFILWGVSCGITYGVKAQAAFSFLIVAFIVFLYEMIRNENKFPLTGLFLIAVFSATIVVFPILLRNYNTYQSILGPESETEIAIGTLRPNYLIVNSLKNIIWAGTPELGGGILNKIIYKISEILYVDINAECISLGGYTFLVHFGRSMDYASAYLAIYFVLVGTLIAIYKNVKYHTFVDVIGGSFILQFYIVTMLIRWQPWVVRLLIPSLVLALIGALYFDVSIIKNLKKMKTKRTITSVLTVGIILECLLANVEMTYYYSSFLPQNSRFEGYFDIYGSSKPYVEMCNRIEENDFSSIGLYTGDNSYQYPILARYYEKKNVENVVLCETKDTSYNLNCTFQPQAVVVANIMLEKNNNYFINGREYECVYIDNSNEEYSLWKVVD